VGGLAGHVEALQVSNFDPPIAPIEGNWFALLSNGPGEVNPASGPDLDVNGSPDNDTSTLSTTFTLAAGQVPVALSFDWNFLTSEAGGWGGSIMMTSSW